jgi:homoserine kinase
MGTDFAVRVEAPASLSNLGPGFDAFGLCIDGIVDEVVITRTDQTGVHVSSIEGVSEGIPADASNTAAVGAREVLRRSKINCGLNIIIIKGIRIGSGIGGSAASAVAGAVAANEILGRPLPETDVIAAGLEAERSAAGAIHGDNVLPCMLGGFVLTTPGAPSIFRRYEVPSDLHIPLLLPNFTVLTEEARAVLPKNVPLTDAAVTAAAAAHAMAALLEGDWKSFGAAIMKDRLVEPQRAKLIEFYSAVKAAALEAGAFGCALSGSGPAMFAVSDTQDRAQSVADAMLVALRHAGHSGSSRVVHANNSGVKVHRSE